ncbi:titan9 [Forsythia ovata]|uniref:Titan9 n=1 Tax=Forsythia ovata TaxID=205694 RepID=A0ABD1UUY6_9LAMI
MEALYAKLYNKYTELKKEKESKLEQLNRDQEVKFVNYAAAADEMIQYLKSENDRLRGQVDELKSELDLIRSSKEKQDIQYQKLLMEENQKNKELSEEILKLNKLEQDGPCHSRHQKFESGRPNTHTGSPVEGASCLSATHSKKKRKSVPAVEGIAMPHVDMELDHAADQCSDRNEVGGALNFQQPACCQRKIDTEGGGATETMNCMFQVLVEFVVGMKLSFVSQKDELCISALHQSSGYSFSLTWINTSGGEAELVYRVLSLGTFERVAPEWMRETLIFSTSMCPVFFERVSRVIKG